MNNPFELTFGLKPSNYISRLKQSEEIISNFKSPTGNKSFLITGVRGTGKTVMLSHISKQFENEKNWIVIELIPNYDMLEQFASALYDTSIMNKIFNNKKEQICDTTSDLYSYHLTIILCSANLKMTRYLKLVPFYFICKQ